MRQMREERGLTLKYVAAFLGVEFSSRVGHAARFLWLAGPFPRGLPPNRT
jgi:hypothetical protein